MSGTTCPQFERRDPRDFRERLGEHLREVAGGEPRGAALPRNI
jgi:hypothetical protein